jgi:hypothetical protein
MHTLVFLPWVHFGKLFEIGDSTFWPWPQESESRIPNSEIRDRVVLILSAYQLHHGYSLNGATVCEFRGSSTADITDEQFMTISNDARLFAFASIAANQFFQSLGHYVNASAFQVIGQRFSLEDDRFSFISRRRDGSNTDSGYEHSEIRQVADAWIRQCHCQDIDEALLHALVQLHETADSAATARIHRAIDWFLRSFTDSATVTGESDLALLLAAFEHLKGGDAKAGWIGEIFVGYVSAEPGIIISTERDPYSSWKQAWFHAFREKRNSLLHGVSARQGADRWNVFWHIFIATIIFVSTIRLELTRLGVYAITEEDETRLLLLDHFIADPSESNWPESMLTAIMNRCGRRARRTQSAESLRLSR